jgi:hypothetical protein
MVDVFVTGIPRSGNTYLSRLIGDALDSPVGGARGAVALATEGQDRPGQHRVMQLHLLPRYGECQEVLPDPRTFCVHCWRDERVVHIVRDPRDVAVSAYHYFDMPTVEAAIRALGEGHGPYSLIGSWRAWMAAWDEIPVPRVRYEALVADPARELERLFAQWGMQTGGIEKAVERQAFSAKREQIAQDGESRPYGREQQLKHLRKGIAGDWRNHFDARCEELAARYFALEEWL